MKYKLIREPTGSRYRFYCELSGATIYTSPIMKEQPSEFLRNQIWEQKARQHFNQCPQCGRWVFNTLFNADTLKCVECSPWEISAAQPYAKEHYENMQQYGFGEEAMKQITLCQNCGAISNSIYQFCQECGQPLTNETLYFYYQLYHENNQNKKDYKEDLS